MDVSHWDNNPCSAEVKKRALAASASKATQQDNAQKPKGSAVMVNVVPQDLFGGNPAGSVHAPAVQAVLTTSSSKNGGPPRPTTTTTTAQQAAPQPVNPG